jgi:hypothetical protein
LHGHLDFLVGLAEVHKRIFKIVLFDSSLCKLLVRHLGLLDHHHNHHFHGITLSHLLLLLHLGLLLLHGSHLFLGALFQFLDVLHGLSLGKSRSFGLTRLLLLKLTLLGHHDELLGSRVAHELLVSHLEFSLVDTNSLHDFLHEILRSLLFMHEHLSNDVGV